MMSISWLLDQLVPDGTEVSVPISPIVVPLRTGSPRHDPAHEGVEWRHRGRGVAVGGLSSMPLAMRLLWMGATLEILKPSTSATSPEGCGPAPRSTMARK